MKFGLWSLAAAALETGLFTQAHKVCQCIFSSAKVIRKAKVHHPIPSKLNDPLRTFVSLTRSQISWLFGFPGASEA